MFNNVFIFRESGEFYLSSAASTMQNSVQNYLSHELPQIDALTSDLNLNSGIVSYIFVRVIYYDHKVNVIVVFVVLLCYCKIKDFGIMYPYSYCYSKIINTVNKSSTTA